MTEAESVSESHALSRRVLFKEACGSDPGENV